jgi:hypothetical protein
MDASAGCARKASAFFFEIDQKKAISSPPRRRDKQTRVADKTALDRRVAREALRHFQRSVAQAFGMFEGVVAEFHRLSDDETLSYLKRQVSPRATNVRAPAGAAFLDGVLCDAPLVGGIAPMLGTSICASSPSRGSRPSRIRACSMTSAPRP